MTFKDWSDPKRFKKDMFEDDSISLKRKAGFTLLQTLHDPWSLIEFACWLQAALFTAGFPCTPFSMLHHGSALLEDDEAQQMYGTVHRIGRLQPCATCQQIVIHVHPGACNKLLPIASEAAILENVVGIKRVYTEVMKLLRATLKETSSCKYFSESRF